MSHRDTFLPQGGNGIRTATTAAAGSSIRVDVGPNDKQITVRDPGSGESTTVPVPPGKTTHITVPNNPGGVVVISVGSGLNLKQIVVEIIQPGP